MKKFMHVHTGSVDTQEGWEASYADEELEQRNLTAAEAFADDEGFTLVEVFTLAWHRVELADGDDEVFSAYRNRDTWLEALSEYRATGNICGMYFAGYRHDDVIEIDWQGFDAALLVEELNAYEGDNIWEDVVHLCGQYDHNATLAADPQHRSDFILLRDGSRIEWDGTEWVVAATGGFKQWQ